MLSERSLLVCDQVHLLSETGCTWNTQKLGNLHAVERPAGKFGVISFLTWAIYLIKGNGGEGQQHFLSYVTGSRLLHWRESCHWWYQQELAWGWGVSHQLLGRLYRVCGRRTPWHLPAAYQPIELNNHHSPLKVHHSSIPVTGLANRTSPNNRVMVDLLLCPKHWILDIQSPILRNINKTYFH